jgi:hypothetical protein
MPAAPSIKMTSTCSMVPVFDMVQMFANRARDVHPGRQFWGTIPVRYVWVWDKVASEIKPV